MKLQFLICLYQTPSHLAGHKERRTSMSCSKVAVPSRIKLCMPALSLSTHSLYLMTFSHSLLLILKREVFFGVLWYQLLAPVDFWIYYMCSVLMFVYGSITIGIL